jgi:hypothetical protein
MNNRKRGTAPIPRWMDEADYYGTKAPERAKHMSNIEWRKRVKAKLWASSGDGSYSINIKLK